MPDTAQAARASNAWPFQQAEKLLKRLDGRVPDKGHVLFETGYGPSGLPHLGTFGEVARTTMVMHAFRALSDMPIKLICFSDDMDGLRKVPTNVPNQDMLAEHLGKPLTQVPDPFGTHASFGAHNNAKLQLFLDRFGFDYQFCSATDCYTAGRFDDTLLKILRAYDKVIKVILPTLGEERRQTYCPFLPISPKSGHVLQVPLVDRDADAGTVTFTDEDGADFTVPVTGGHVKCQWKVDWAMRWDALDVDYEMAGKDLIESVKLSSIIRRILGGVPPEGFSYELFLDEKGEKISKSRGNGLTIEEWLTYASPQSLSLYMYQSPRKAKRLYFDVIPKAVDEYYTHLAKYADQDDADKLANPVWHIHSAGRRPAGQLRPAAQPGQCGARRGQGGPVGLRVALRARGHRRQPSGTGPADGLCPALLRRLRRPHQGLSPARHPRARRHGRPGRPAGSTAGRRRCRGDPVRSLRGRQGARF